MATTSFFTGMHNRVIFFKGKILSIKQVSLRLSKNKNKAQQRAILIIIQAFTHLRAI
jgi:hypothetical protein